MTKAVFPDWSRGSRTPLGGSLPNQCFIICFKKGITFSVRKFRSIIYERCASVSLCTRTVAAFHFYDAFHHRKCRWRASHQWSGYIGDSVMIPSKFILPALHQLIISIRLQLITFFPNEWSADTFRMAKVIGWVGGKAANENYPRWLVTLHHGHQNLISCFCVQLQNPGPFQAVKGRGQLLSDVSMNTCVLGPAEYTEI